MVSGFSQEPSFKSVSDFSIYFEKFLSVYAIIALQDHFVIAAAYKNIFRSAHIRSHRFLKIRGGFILMKTAVMYGKQDVRVEDRPIPKVGPGQMLVKISYVGICGTDVEFFNSGEVPTPLPKILGHENSGVVVKVGEGVTNFQQGDKVLCGPPKQCREGCPSCRAGKPNICIHGFPNTAGIGMPDGGYAEYFLVRDVAHTMVIKVPEEVDLKDAVLFDVICVALHGIRISRFKLGDAVVVSGMGPVGLSAVQFLKAGGARKVIALDISDEKAEIARRYGADLFINTTGCENLSDRIKEACGSETGADVVYECAGNPKSFHTCIYDCVKPGGQVMGIGTIQQPLDMIPGQISIFEIDIQFSFVYTEDEVEMYLSMLADGKVEFPDMVTGIVSLDDCVEKGLGLKDRSRELKILIQPDQRGAVRRLL